MEPPSNKNQVSKHEITKPTQNIISTKIAQGLAKLKTLTLKSKEYKA